MSTKQTDGIDGYNESVWQNLGHPAFEENFIMANEDIEWWDIEDE